MFYPKGAINRAQGLVGAVSGALYAKIRDFPTMNVASATLANPQELRAGAAVAEPAEYSDRNGRFQTPLSKVPPATGASPQQRGMVDMTDAAAQAALKRAMAMDAIADTEMQAADRINTELQATAPGTAPMIEAEAAAWLVRQTLIRNRRWGT